MKFTKIAFGLSLTAAFGLMACGDDSSSGPSNDNVVGGGNVPKCSVSSTDNSVSYTMSNALYSLTEKISLSEGNIVITEFKQSYEKGSVSEAAFKIACEDAKRDAEEDGDDVDFNCKDNVISGKWTEKIDEEEAATYLKEMKEEFQLICGAMNDALEGNGGDKKPSSSDSNGKEPSGDDDDDKKQPGSSSKEDCSFKMDSDTWSYGYYNIGLGGDMTKTYTISGNEYKILYTYKGESLDAQSTSGKFSDSYTRKDMFNEAQDHCLTVNGLKDSSDDEDDDDDYESPVGSDDDDDYGFDSPVDMDSLLSEIEKMPECTKSNEGDKTTYLGMSMICKDGEWEPDMEDLGIDLGNCDSFKKSDDVWTKTMNVMGMEMTETYKWIDATTVEYTSSVKGLEAFAETETLEDQDRDDLYEYFCEE